MKTLHIRRLALEGYIAQQKQCYWTRSGRSGAAFTAWRMYTPHAIATVLHGLATALHGLTFQNPESNSLTES